MEKQAISREPRIRWAQRRVEVFDGFGSWVHVRPSAFPVEAEVVEVDRQGQHKKKTAFYGRSGNGTREITEPKERDRYRLQVWGR